MGISRSTLDRMRRDGGFPQAEQISPNRVGWRLDAIESFRHAQFKQLATHAVAQAEDLEPDELDVKALGLILQSMEKRTGRKPNAEGLAVHITQALTEADVHAAEKIEFTRYAERFAGLDKRRTCVLAAWLFESIRADIECSAPSREKLIYGDPSTLEKFGRAALHDEDWEAAISEFDAAEGSS